MSGSVIIMALTLLLIDGKLVLDTGSLVVTQNAAECECCDPVCAVCYEYVDIVLPGLTDNAFSCCNEIDILSWQIPHVSSTPRTDALDCYYEKSAGFTNAGCTIVRIEVLITYSISLNQMSIDLRLEGDGRLLHAWNSGTISCTAGPWSVPSSVTNGCATSGNVSITPGPAL